MQSIRRVRALRRLREIATEARRFERPPPDPGPLLSFIPRYNRGYREPIHLSDFTRAIEHGLRRPGSVRACFSYPIRHGKTETIIAAIAWLLAKDPTRKILYVTYAHSRAKKITGRAKTLAALAGVALGSSRRKDYWETAAGGFVQAAGIGGQITGEGYTDVFVDDPHKNRAEAESRTIREGVIEAFFHDVSTRLDPRGTNFFIVHARWHVNDLIGVLTNERKRYVRFNSPALKDGKPLAPWLVTLKSLLELIEDLGPYGAAGLLFGAPIPRGGALFGDATHAIFAEPKNSRVAIGLDLAHKVTTRSDWNAAVVMRLDLGTVGRTDTKPILDILEAVRSRGTFTDRAQEHEDEEGNRTRVVIDEGFVRQVARLCLTYPDATLVMYAQDAELATLELFERELTAKLREVEPKRKAVRIVVKQATSDKYMRAQKYATTWNDGRARIPGRLTVDQGHTPKDEKLNPKADAGRNRAGWEHALVNEHVNFQGIKGEENDQVDAAAAAHDHLIKPQPKKGGRTSGRGNEADRLAAIM